MLLTKKSALECETAEELEQHNAEVIEILNNLQQLENLPCAVLEDVDGKIRINRCYLHDLSDITDWSDTRCGADISVDNSGEYLTIINHGIDKSCSFRIMPYDEERNFINIVSWIKNGKLMVAMDQKEF